MFLFLEGVICLILFGVAGVILIRQERKLPTKIREDKETLEIWYFSRFSGIVVLHPIAEEFIFRLPLILLFTKFDYWAYVWILISAGLFALAHNMPGALDRVSWEKRNIPKITRRIYLQFFCGIFLGTLAIWLQSLLAVVLCHALWNFYLWALLQREVSSWPSIADKLLLSEWYVLKLRWKIFLIKLRSR